MTAGAIHRADPGALVTNGSWAFIASSDAGLGKTAPQATDLRPDELQHIRQSLSAKYGHSFTEAETRQFYDAFHSQANFNYYTDERLIAAGGDPDGTLDFYSVHYYEWAGTSLSPFHHDYEVWQLTKPLVIGEFYLGGSSDSGGDGDPDNTYGIPYLDLYPTLYDRGYAGAHAWQWYNYPHSAEGVISWPRILESTELMLDLHPEAIAIDRGLQIVQFEAEPPGIETELFERTPLVRQQRHLGDARRRSRRGFRHAHRFAHRNDNLPARSHRRRCARHAGRESNGGRARPERGQPCAHTTGLRFHD